MHLHAEYGPHGSLNDFRIEYVNRIMRCKDCIDAEPLGNSENRSQIARIPDGVKRKIQTTLGKQR